MSRTKEELECENLELENRKLRHPVRHNPATWISAATAIAALFAVVLQYRLSHAEYVLAEAKAMKAQEQIDTVDEKIQAKTAQLWKVEKSLAQKQEELKLVREQLNASNQRYAAATDQLRDAAALLDEVKSEVPPELGRKIIDLNSRGDRLLNNSSSSGIQ